MIREIRMTTKEKKVKVELGETLHRKLKYLKLDQNAKSLTEVIENNMDFSKKKK